MRWQRVAETTQNYNLTCPAGTDYYNIAVQNENMQKIDRALAESINVGAYVGDGETERVINLSRTPKFVLVIRNGSEMDFRSENTFHAGGLAITGHPAQHADVFIEIVEGGFRVMHYPDGRSDSQIKLCMNTTGSCYSYIWG